MHICRWQICIRRLKISAKVNQNGNSGTTNRNEWIINIQIGNNDHWILLK